MNDDCFRELKTRLHQDAERLLEAQDQRPPIAALLEQHHDRRRRRTVARSATGLALLALGLTATWAAWGLQSPLPAGSRPDGKPPLPDSREQLVVEAPPPVSASAGPISVVDRGTAQADAGIIPIVLVRTNADGEQLLIPGLYIPERSMSVDFSRLSRAQQRAIRMVLGLEEKQEPRKPI